MTEPSPTDAGVVRRPDAVATGPAVADGESGKTRKVKRKKGWLARLVGAGIVLVLILAGVVLALPLVVSSGWGTQRVLAIVNGAVPGTVEVDDLRMGWLSPIEVDGLRYRDERGVERVSAERLFVESRPIDLLGGLDLGTVRVSGVKAEVVRDEEKDSAEKKPEKERADEASEPVRWPDGLRVRLEVEDASVRLVSRGQRDVVVSTQAPVVIDARDPSAVVAELAVTVVSGRRSGAMTAGATVRGLVDSAGVIRPERSTVELTAGLSSVPTPMVARLAGLPEILPALIGPVVDVSLEAEGSALSPTATLSVRSERLEVDAAVGLSESGLRVDPSATRASWLVLPAAMALLTGGEDEDGGTEPGVALAEPVRVAVGVERLELPVTEGVADLASAALRGSVTVSDAVVKNVGAEGKGERWRLSETKLVVGGEPVGERLAVVATGKAGVVMGEGPGVEPEAWRLGLRVDEPLAERGTALPRLSGSGELPTALVAVLADQPGLPEMLGDRVRVVDLRLAEADGDQGGGGMVLGGRLEGAGSYAEFGAALSGERVLTLTRSAEAELPLNRALVDGYLKRLLPLLVGLEGSAKSARLTVAEDGFRAELEDGFDAERLTGRGTLELETIPVTERSVLGRVWLAMRAAGRTQDRALEVAFEPVRFAVADGRLTYTEGAFVLGTVRMAFSGGVDLGTESVLIAIDVPAESLRKVLGFKRIADDETLRVRLEGTVDELRFDTAGLAREITRLAAREAVDGDDPEDELLRRLIDGVLRPR